jgi:hypothetical protein
MRRSGRWRRASVLWSGNEFAAWPAPSAMRRSAPAVERGLESWVVDLADSAEQCIGEISPQHRAELRNLSRFAQPVEPRGERLLKRRRDSGRQPRRARERRVRRPFCATSARSRGLSEITLWWERRLQGGRNSGRAVARMSIGPCAPRSASACIRSSEVGSAQCRSSNASATGCERTPARNHVTSAASCRRRNSSGASFAARSSGSGMSTSGAIRGAYSEASRPMSRSVFSRSARRRAVGSSAPKRWRPHSAIGCKGVFCNSCDDDSSTRVWGVSPSVARNSSTRRDLPMPGSPTISASCPAPLRARSQRRRSSSSSSSRPTRGVRERAPVRLPPLARTMR